MGIFIKLIFGNPWAIQWARAEDFSGFDLCWVAGVCHCTWEVPVVVNRVWPYLAAVSYVVSGPQGQGMCLSYPHLSLALENIAVA